MAYSCRIPRFESYSELVARVKESIKERSEAEAQRRTSGGDKDFLGNGEYSEVQEVYRTFEEGDTQGDRTVR